MRTNVENEQSQGSNITTAKHIQQGKSNEYKLIL